ncbi:MAG TPA: hypothetical protein VMV49_12740, partial [Candidatus Deferrimicrobium sp.]|nr:hypothetical protein [Candidatus Deferrimicrobium sp.]
MKKQTKFEIFFLGFFLLWLGFSMLPLQQARLANLSAGIPIKILTDPLEIISETRANNYTTEEQQRPSVSWLTDTTFVVAW